MNNFVWIGLGVLVLFLVMNGSKGSKGSSKSLSTSVSKVFKGNTGFIVLVVAGLLLFMCMNKGLVEGNGECGNIPITSDMVGGESYDFHGLIYLLESETPTLNDKIQALDDIDFQEGGRKTMEDWLKCKEGEAEFAKLAASAQKRSKDVSNTVAKAVKASTKAFNLENGIQKQWPYIMGWANGTDKFDDNDPLYDYLKRIGILSRQGTGGCGDQKCTDSVEFCSIMYGVNPHYTGDVSDRDDITSKWTTCGKVYEKMSTKDRVKAVKDFHTAQQKIDKNKNRNKLGDSDPQRRPVWNIYQRGLDACKHAGTVVECVE